MYTVETGKITPNNSDCTLVRLFSIAEPSFDRPGGPLDHGSKMKGALDDDLLRQEFLAVSLNGLCRPS